MLELQKANFWKRISAWLLDAILLLMLSVGILSLLSMINLNDYVAEIDQREAAYAEKYGIEPDKVLLTEEEYNALPEAEQKKYDDMNEERNKDDELNRLYNLAISLALAYVPLSILLSYVIFEFIIPLFLKNGQTIGKKIFALGVMHTNQVRVSSVALFVRSILGKYAIETMIPLLLLLRMVLGSGGIFSIIILLIIFVTQVVFLLTTKGRFAIHDMISSTVVVDLPSQKIFKDADELNDYKKRLHAEMVDKSGY